jgi:ABC-2 type transport system permease protein
VISADTVVLFPLTLARNVFVQPRTVPGWLQAFVSINPVASGLFGGSGRRAHLGSSAGVAAAALAAMTALVSAVMS